MSVQEKLAQVLGLLDKHNSSVEDQADKVNVEEFQRKLKKLGGTTEEALAEAKWEDLQNAGLPVILARRAAEIFRQPAKVEHTSLSPKAAERVAILYLLQQYNPNDPDSVVARELKRRSDGKKFVVMSSDGKVLVEKSNELYSEVVLKKFPERDQVTVDDVDYAVYPAGQGKAELYDESPIFVGRALRPDGTDDQLNRSWQGVPLEVRQLIRIAVVQGELNPTQEKAHAIFDIAIGSDAMKKIRERYKKSSVKFNELKEQGDLPKLKISRIGADRGKQQDPFYKNQTF